MAEFPPPEFPIDAPATTATTTANIITPAILPPSADTITTTNNDNNVGPSLAPKRQRRPSVRLGEIGDQPATDSHAPRRPKPCWRFYKHPGLLASKSSKTRPLTNLVNGHEILAHDNLDFHNRKPKSKRARVRTNWTAAIDNNKGGNIQGESRDAVVDNNKNSNEEFIRDFEAEIEGSDSPVKEQSPIQSVDDVGLDYWRRNGRVRVSETSGDRNFGSGNERGLNRSNGFLDDGVRNWLVGLGLGRYAAVFEIHEVDDQVLPMLTLEDLKDMGINAVGSRRKLYSAIQKLPKGFS